MVAIEWKGGSPIQRTEIDGLMAQLCSEDLDIKESLPSLSKQFVTT